MFMQCWLSAWSVTKCGNSHCTRDVDGVVNLQNPPTRNIYFKIVFNCHTLARLYGK